MTRCRTPAHPFSRIPRNDEQQLDGFQVGWLNYDRRSFSDILRQWQDKTAPNAPASFIEHQLRLDGALSERDLLRLLTGEAAPSIALTRWLSAVIPTEIASPRVFRNRGLSAFDRANPSRLVEIDPTAIRNARLDRLKEIATGEDRPEASHPSAPFRDELMELLCEKAGRDDIDPEATLDNVAKYLHIPAEALRGCSFLPENEAKAAGNELAALLGLRGEEFDGFADRAACSLVRRPGAAPATALTRLASAARFLRQQAGLTQVELARRLGYASKIAVLALEKGYPTIVTTKLASALDLDKPDTAILAQLTSEAFQELIQPTAGRKPTPLEQVVEHFAADGLTTSAYLKAALRQPSLLGQFPATIVGNIEGVVAYFADHGLTTGDYLKAVLQQPSLFHQSPATIVGNIEGFVEHFADHGLTTSAYLKAALKRPQLFYGSPATIVGNIEGVVAHFTADGLTTSDYLKAALKQPGLLTMSPVTIAGNIEGVVAYFADHGLTTSAYLKAALRQPSLFHQSPATIAGNIEDVVERFAAEGMTTGAYFKAALRHPQLFCQSPATIAGYIALVLDLNDRGIFHPPSNPATKVVQSPAAAHPHAAVINFLLRNPNLMCMERENYALREIHQQMTAAPRNSMLLRHPRYAVERELMRHLGHDDPERPVPNDGFVAGSQPITEENARRFVLRALLHSGLIRSGSLER